MLKNINIFFIRGIYLKSNFSTINKHNFFRKKRSLFLIVFLKFFIECVSFWSFTPQASVTFLMRLS